MNRAWSYKCRACGQQFMYHDELAEHYIDAHDWTYSVPNKTTGNTHCIVCGAWIRTMQDLVEHFENDLNDEDVAHHVATMRLLAIARDAP